MGTDSCEDDDGLVVDDDEDVVVDGPDDAVEDDDGRKLARRARRIGDGSGVRMGRGGSSRRRER